MLDKDRLLEIKEWLKNNNIPESRWENIIKMLKTHKLTEIEGDYLNDLLKRYERIKKLVVEIQHDLSLLPEHALKDLDILQEDTLLREQFRLYNEAPKHRLEPRHLGDIDISLYFSSLELTLENIPKVKNPHNNSNEKIYYTLLWFSHSLDEEYKFGITKTKSANFIAACTGHENIESVKRQIDRLMDKHNWDFFKRTNPRP